MGKQVDQKILHEKSGTPCDPRVSVKAADLYTPLNLGVFHDLTIRGETLTNCSASGCLVTPEDFRRIALSFSGAIESSHMDHPDFRVGGRIFATLWKGNGVVMVQPDQQLSLVKSNPDVFSPVKGGWGRKGATTVHLEKAAEESARMALSMAWQNKIPKRQRGD